MKKIYYLLRFIPESPLRIGNGMHEKSDNDLMLDGRGMPFIPGTSIAGIIRHQAIKFSADNAILGRLFGDIEKADGKDNKEDLKHIPSAIIIGDAVLKHNVDQNKVFINKRDSIALGEWGTTIPKSKYDFQISETDQEFYSVLEWTGSEKQEEDEIKHIIEPVLGDYANEGISVGARTSRGYGRFKIRIYKRTFSFPADLNEWLQFSPYDYGAFGEEMDIEKVSTNRNCKIEIGFRMKSTFSIRVKKERSETIEDNTHTPPRSVPLENFQSKPVIPGSVWAGTFRHHMHQLLRDVGIEEESDEMKNLDILFGMSSMKNGNKKSILKFYESVIQIDDKEKQKLMITRTAIDRFTSSPRTAALYTSLVYCGGKGVLQIEFDHKSLTCAYRELLAACICDMHTGILTVGGQSSVGSGIMEIENLIVNGKNKITDLLASVKNAAPLSWL